jgi:hypothetical protein
MGKDTYLCGMSIAELETMIFQLIIGSDEVQKLLPFC